MTTQTAPNLFAATSRAIKGRSNCVPDTVPRPANRDSTTVAIVVDAGAIDVLRATLEALEDGAPWAALHGRDCPGRPNQLVAKVPKGDDAQ